MNEECKWVRYSASTHTITMAGNGDASDKVDQASQVYIRDDQFVWLPGTIVDGDAEAGRLKVRIELPPGFFSHTDIPNNAAARAAAARLHHEERWIDLNDYMNHHLPLQNDKTVRDVAQLSHLSEASLLYMVKARHAKKQPYTRCGDIVIAMNPCEPLSELYTTEQQRLYAKTFVWQGKGELAATC